MPRDIVTAEARFYNGYWKINVQREGCRKSFYCKTPGRQGKRECERKAQAWVDGKFDTDPRIDKAVEAYLAHKKATVSEGTYKATVSMVKHLYASEDAGKRLSRITIQYWQDIVNGLAASGSTRKSIAQVIGMIVNFTSFCVKNRWDIDRIASSDIDMPRTVEKERKDIIQPEHIRILFDRSVDDWYINAYRIAVILGMRRGEIAGLQWSDINDGVLSVNRMLRGDGIITEGKTKNARRTIKLPEQASQVLLLQAEKLNRNGILREWVFPSADGIARPNSIYKAWQRFCKLHGFPENVDFHSLRRTMISMHKDDMPLELLKSIVGHSASMDTFGIYGRTVNGEAERTAALLDGTFQKVLNG